MDVDQNWHHTSPPCTLVLVGNKRFLMMPLTVDTGVIVQSSGVPYPPIASSRDYEGYH